jgi:hypothetical protein
MYVFISLVQLRLVNSVTRVKTSCKLKTQMQLYCHTVKKLTYFTGTIFNVRRSRIWALLASTRRHLPLKFSQKLLFNLRNTNTKHIIKLKNPIPVKSNQSLNLVESVAQMRANCRSIHLNVHSTITEIRYPVKRDHAKETWPVQL